jgi:hypothetical protein
VAAACPRPCGTSSSSAPSSKRASGRLALRIDNIFGKLDQGSKTLDNVTHQLMSQTQNENITNYISYHSMRRCIKTQLNPLRAKHSANMIDTHISFLEGDSGLRGREHINDLVYR